MADAVFLSLLRPNEVTYYPAAYAADASGDGAVRTYPTGVTYDALVQAKQSQRMTAQGLIESYTKYTVYLPADIGAKSDDKFVWNRDGKALYVSGSLGDMGGTDEAYSVVCEERA